MPRLSVTDTLCRDLISKTQIWRTSIHIMGIGCENVNKPLVQHSFGPVSRISTKGAS
jgi:hypothetical protein